MAEAVRKPKQAITGPDLCTGQNRQSTGRIRLVTDTYGIYGQTLPNMSITAAGKLRLSINPALGFGHCISGMTPL
jgi:hypothetical protein